MVATAWLAAAFAAVPLAHAIATPRLASALEVHEKRSARSDRWVKQRRLADDHVLPVKISLVQSNIDEGATHLLSISDPKSASYGQHWSSQDVADFFEPAQLSLDAVTAWLQDSGISSDRITYSKLRGTLGFHADASEAETLFNTTFHEYSHQDAGSSALGCDHYSLPSHIRQHVDFVTPTLQLMAPKTKKHARRASSDETRHMLTTRATMQASNTSLVNCSTAMTPVCIKTLYSITDFTGTPSKNNSLGIYASEYSGLNSSFSQNALNGFFGNYSSNIPQGTSPIPASINGALVESEVGPQIGEETMLDLSMAFPIVYPQNITLFVANEKFSPDATNPNPPNSGVEVFFDAIDGSYCANSNSSLDCGKYATPNVVSFSYGTLEDEIPYNYAKRVCDEVMKLSLQGTTVVASSGDFNLGSFTYTCGGENGNVFQPDWIGSCPWVLSVGGTMVKNNGDVTQPGVETVWHSTEDFGAGSGFSNYYPMPDYQNATVSQYLATANISFPSYAQFATTDNATTLGEGTDGVFNRIGRAYPDVSALAFMAIFYDANGYFYNDGTSVATPIWAAIINRINEERLAAGKSTVGFVQPTLYQNPDAFNDITEGSNFSCNTTGFPAQEGWDAVSGLGTPNFPKLLEVFMNLP